MCIIFSSCNDIRVLKHWKFIEVFNDVIANNLDQFLCGELTGAGCLFICQKEGAGMSLLTLLKTVEFECDKHKKDELKTSASDFYSTSMFLLPPDFHWIYFFGFEPPSASSFSSFGWTMQGAIFEMPLDSSWLKCEFGHRLCKSMWMWIQKH